MSLLKASTGDNALHYIHCLTAAVRDFTLADTPPNAMVSSSGYMRMRDMVRAGIPLDVASILVIQIISLTILMWVYD